MSDDHHTVERQGADILTAETPRVLTSSDLFAGEREIVIEHEAEYYRLRWTSKGKLILTK